MQFSVLHSKGWLYYIKKTSPSPISSDFPWLALSWHHKIQQACSSVHLFTVLCNLERTGDRGVLFVNSDWTLNIAACGLDYFCISSKKWLGIYFIFRLLEFLTSMSVFWHAAAFKGIKPFLCTFIDIKKCCLIRYWWVLRQQVIKKKKRKKCHF